MTSKVLFVCLGNICRSPTAHAVFRQKALQAGFAVEIESAGTSAAHQGEAPDQRSVRQGQLSGYSFDGIVSRPVMSDDFAYYDLILAMDKSNLQELHRRCPPILRSKLHLLLEYHPDYPQQQEVPDPYYGGQQGFAHVLQLIEQSCDQLLSALQK